MPELVVPELVVPEVWDEKTDHGCNDDDGSNYGWDVFSEIFEHPSQFTGIRHDTSSFQGR